MGMSGLMLGLMFAGPLIGRALDRYSIRWLVAIGGLLLAVGCALMSPMLRRTASSRLL